jgi:hypothetical protein
LDDLGRTHERLQVTTVAAWLPPAVHRNADGITTVPER